MVKVCFNIEYFTISFTKVNVFTIFYYQEYIKQASSMLSNIGEPGMVGLQNEQIIKLGQLQEHLKEQERGYLILLERMLGDDTTVHIEGRSSQNSGESFATSIAESASINVDARSDISEASTVNSSSSLTKNIKSVFRK